MAAAGVAVALFVAVSLLAGQAASVRTLWVRVAVRVAGSWSETQKTRGATKHENKNRPDMASLNFAFSAVSPSLPSPSLRECLKGLEILQEAPYVDFAALHLLAGA
jgi:hypothetical protein